MTAPHWWVRGVLFENCSCQLICPAHVSFKQRCENDRCVGHWAVHIANGSFDDVAVADLNVVVLFDAPVLMHDGGWTQRLYLDERASEPQRRALEQIFTGAAGGPWERIGQFVATRLETHVVPIRYEDRDGEKRLLIPGLFSTTVTPIRGRDGKSPAVLSNLHNVIHGLVHVLARGSTESRDEGLSFSTENTHGLCSDFSWNQDGASAV